MSQDMSSDAKSGPVVGLTLHGSFVIPAIALVAFTLSLYYFNDSRNPTPIAGVSAVVPQQATMAQPPPASAHHAKAPLTIDTERGELRAEFNLDKLLAARAQQIVIVRADNFNNHPMLGTAQDWNS